ncbi:MAG: aldo/keto reductase [Actinobacteria bacterium]|nr:MAG: aldo/keto reductase [Actinomycetota bacterium]
MRTTQLGPTGMEITRVGFGAWALGGGGFEWSWGSQEDEDSIAAIRAIAGLDERPYVFTKGGQPPGPNGTTLHSLQRDSLRRELEGSLTRLGLDAVDLYQIHWPVPDKEIEAGWAALVEFRDEGLTRHIGVSNFDVDQLSRAQRIAPVDTLQPPYSLIDREVEAEILPFAEREGIGVIAYSPMSSGLLTGSMTRERIEALPDDDWRKRDPRFRDPELARHLELVERLRSVAERHGTTPGAVAAAWTLRHPAVDAAIVGFRRPDQVDPIVVAANLEFGEDEVAAIEGSA